MSLGKALTGIASNFEWLAETGSNRWQLDSKTEKVISLSAGQGTLTNKWVPKPMDQSFQSYSIDK